jgi:hypothetical protein
MVQSETSSFYYFFFTARLDPPKTNEFSSDIKQRIFIISQNKLLGFMNITYKHLIAAAIAVYFCCTNSASAATEGKIIVFPWVMEGTTAEYNVSARSALQTALTKASNQVGDVTLLEDDYKNAPNRVRNIAKAINQFLKITPAEENALKDTIIVQPYMCKIGNTIIATTVSHLWSTREVIDISYQTFEPEIPLKKSKAKRAFQRNLDENIKSLINARKQLEKDTNNLKIKLTTKRGGIRKYNSSNYCLSHLLAASLAKDFKVVTTVGYENYSLLRRSKLLPPSRPMRATRELIVDWKQQTNGAMEYTIENAEAVFGQSINDKMIGTIDYTQRTRALDIASRESLFKYLEQEQSALNLIEKPMIAKTYKAWSYVDKGRAWGLKIGDRLTTRGKNGEPIKGHVVGYFGPEHKITSPRGYPVHEGAIIYVRKGQSMAIKGQIFDWDTKKFPTPWPPKLAKE